MDMEFIHIIIVQQSMKDNGLMIYNMEKELKNTSMEIYIKDNSRKEEDMELVNTPLQMGGYMKEIGRMEKCKEREYLVG